MSFSKEVKEELVQQVPQARHCLLAELSAIVAMCGMIGETQGVPTISIRTENAAVARKCFTLLKKTFNIGNEVFAEISVRNNQQGEGHSFSVHAKGVGLIAITDALVQATCCKRAYLRGAFLVSGSVNDPSKAYHMEIVCSHKEMAEYLQRLMHSFQIEAKIVERKKHFVTYVKDGSSIVDMLNVMGAHKALMELENVRILKEMRNSVNRKVNCEAANINKTVSAAVKQVEDIIFIRDTIGFDGLPDGLRDVALTRLENQQASLKEIGELLDTPVGKSGVNHRLRKLSEIAERLRE